LLGCDAQPDAPGCEVTVRRQIEMHRTLAPVIVCQEALLGFAASHADRRNIVGINIVAAEDAYVSRIDYLPHMNLIGNLGRIHPDVGRALHAGELAEGLVPPNDLRFHIGAAVCTGGAQRIGHGVDITYEADSGPVLRAMTGKAGWCPSRSAGPVALEVNLVSNAQLLGVQGKEHPFPLYREAGVPVVLSTDDPGIMRTSLTEQYRAAGLGYPQLRYADLRTLNRNSLEYSFLAGASLWEDPGAYRRPVAACRAAAGGFDLDRCAGWAQGQGDKARVQLQLERRLRAFESRWE
ncbi:MAG: adenosine deaminase, partial [Thermoanaerobaculia bacterium]